MTILLEKAFDAARGLPPDMQNAIAKMMMLFTGDTSDYVNLTEEEEKAVMNSKAAAERGEYASDERMNAIWTKYGS